MRDDVFRLQDILEAIENIEKYTAKGREAFYDDELIRAWFLHHLHIIGEAASRLSPSLTGQHAQVPWGEIVSMRNLLVHAYFQIEDDEIWTTVERDIPLLKSEILDLLKK